MARRVPPGGPRKNRARRARTGPSRIGPGRAGERRTSAEAYEDGMEMLASGRPADAFIHFEGMIKDYPDSPDGHAGLGFVIMSDGGAEGALRHSGAALEMGDGRADTVFTMGNAYKTLGRHREALASYRKALALRPDYAAVHFNAAYVHAMEKNYKEALDSADLALRHDPGILEAAIIRDLALLNMGRREEAMRHLGAAAASSPDSGSAKAGMGYASLLDGDLDGALECFEKARSMDLLDLGGDFKRGLKLYESGDYAGAYESYAAAAEDEQLLQARAGMAAAVVRTHYGDPGAGWRDEALQLALKSIGCDPSYTFVHSMRDRLGAAGGPPGGGAGPGSPESRLEEAMGILMAEGNIAAGLSRLGALAAAEPDFADGHAGLAVALGMAGDGKGAISEFKEALRLGADDANTYNNMGNAYDMLGMAKEAEECYRKASSPDHLQKLPRPDLAADRIKSIAQYNLAESYRQSGRGEDALRQAGKSLRLDPGDFVASLAKGSALADMGKFSESIEPLLKAAEAMPESYEARIQLGVSFSATKNTEEALRCFEEAIRLDRDDPRGHHERGNMLARLERFQEAYDSYARSAELAPRAQTYANMATALFNMHSGQSPGAWHAEALGLADKAIGADPKYGYAHLMKARLLAVAGRDSEAEKHLLRASQLDPAFAWDITASHLGSDNAERRRAALGRAYNAGPGARRGKKRARH